MKTALEQAINTIEQMAKDLIYKSENNPNLPEPVDTIRFVNKYLPILEDLLQTEQDQLRSAYNSSCHEVSFDEWYSKKFKAEEN